MYVRGSQYTENTIKNFFFLFPLFIITPWSLHNKYWKQRFSQRVLTDLYCREPGFLTVEWFSSSPTPSTVSKLDWRHTGRLKERETNYWREKGRGWARSLIIPQGSLVLYSIDHSILPGLSHLLNLWKAAWPGCYNHPSGNLPTPLRLEALCLLILLGTISCSWGTRNK